MSSNKSFSSETSERYSLALLELAKEVRMRKAEKLANEMVDKGHMWNKHFDRPGSLLKPLKDIKNY